jgi:hypothetical protein
MMLTEDLRKSVQMHPLELPVQLQLALNTTPAGPKTTPRLRSHLGMQAQLRKVHIALMPILMVMPKNRALRASRAA